MRLPERSPLTVAEFARHPAGARAAELVRGEIRMMTPASGAHGAIAGTVFAAVHAFVESRAFGVCFPDNTGFALPNTQHTVRSPDMAFVRAERLSPAGIGDGFLAVTPDLIVEVLSPTETASDLEDKLRDYRAAGTSLVWVIDPDTRMVCVRPSDAPERWLTDADILDGGRVLPGFTLPVARLFAHLAPPRHIGA